MVLAPQLQYTIESGVAGEVTRVSFRGQNVILDEGNTKLLEDELSRLVVDQGRSRLVVDLGNVSYLTSSTLAAFLALHKRLWAMGGRLVLANPQAYVEEVFLITSLDRILDIRKNGLAGAGANPPSPAGAG
jgi:anti-sigma B factor antagonist